jgi:hypothetical protein
LIKATMRQMYAVPIASVRNSRTGAHNESKAPLLEGLGRCIFEA